MTLPGLGFRRTIERAYRHPLVWLARELSVDALSGQAGVLTRTATGTSTDTAGVGYTANHSQPRWNLNGGVATLELLGSASEALHWVSPFGVVVCSGLLDFFENGTLTGGGNDAMFAITNPTPSGAYVLIRTNGTQYLAQHYNGTSSVTSVMTGTAPTNGQRVRLRWAFNANGSVQIWQSINGAAETTPGASSTLSPAAAWGSPTQFQVNRASDVAYGYGTTKLVGVAVMQGVQSQATLLAALT